MHPFDINCDMGEGMAGDESIMPFINSANIACGGHAGDEDSMRRTLQLCIQYGVAAGAHPSYPDRENFGRKEIQMADDELLDAVKRQIQELQKIAAGLNTTLVHVKPHGALYNVAAKNRSIAALIARAVRETDEDLVLVGLSGSHLVSEAKALGLKTCSEAFADRTYQDDGSLTPRSHPQALITDEKKAAAQVLEMISKGVVTTLSGKKVPIAAETICVHGDGVNATAIAKALSALQDQNRRSS